MRISARQREVLKIIVDFGSECWGDVWSHCDWPGPGALAFRNFDRVANALIRNGFVSEGDWIEVTALGKQALGLDEDMLTDGERRAASRRRIAGL